MIFDEESVSDTKKFLAPPKRRSFEKKSRIKFFGRRKKMKCREVSETRFAKVSRRSEPCSRGKRPFKAWIFVVVFGVQNSKRKLPKNNRYNETPPHPKNLFKKPQRENHRPPVLWTIILKEDLDTSDVFDLKPLASFWSSEPGKAIGGSVDQIAFVFAADAPICSAKPLTPLLTSTFSSKGP